jgi:hypothetical protein
VGTSDSDMLMQPSVNFHHLTTRKFFLQSQTKSVFVKYTVFSPLDKGHRNKAAASEAEAYPLVRAACLASLSAFQFPQTAIVSPSGVLGSV